MKNTIKTFVLILSMTGTFTACNLDVVPPADMAAENFWKTDKDAWYALNTCYAELDGSKLYDECCTDNAHSHKPWEGNMEILQQNGLSASASYGDYYFGTIRIVNNFLANVESCNMSEELKERMKAEARFFRAYSYLKLTSFYGKVAIIKDVMPYNAPTVSRDPVDKVQAFILDELSDIAKILPEQYKGGYLHENGRITRWGALALRARAALYFGKFSEAEASANEIITKSKHALFRLEGTLTPAQLKEAQEMDAYIDYVAKGIDRDKFIRGLFSYEALWFEENANPNNPEYLVTREYAADPNNYDWMRYTYMIPQSMSAYEGYISYEPMQDLVDAYWNVDGYTLPTPISNKVRAERFETIWNDFKEQSNDQNAFQKKVQQTDLMKYEYMNEFRNRDSRLYASLMFPFKGWHELPGKETFYFMFNPDNFPTNGNESWSGYAFRKMVSMKPYDTWTSSADYPVIRYAEILLTYAEAHVQTTGWDQSVQKALNDLRDRCGMPPVPTSFSKEDALAFIRNERRIELAGEGQRFQDIRRYGEKYCEQYMNGPTYNPAGKLLVNKVWDKRLMLMPIPQSAIDFNPLLKDDQNPGY